MTIFKLVIILVLLINDEIRTRIIEYRYDGCVSKFTASIEKFTLRAL